MEKQKSHQKANLLILLFLFACCQVGASPQLFMQSLFLNESITSTSEYGNRITMGFGKGSLHTTASLRFQYPETSLTFHATQGSTSSKELVHPLFLANIHYFSHAQNNGSTSALVAFGFSARTPFSPYATMVTTSAGVHMNSSWSKSHDHNLWSFSPHLAISCSQEFMDLLFLTLFITTDTLSLHESQLAFFYGGSAALALSDTLFLVVRPLVRFSDLRNESQFITMREISFAICWAGPSERATMLRDLGVWL